SHGPTEAAGLVEVLASLASPRADPVTEAQFRDQLAHLCANLDGAERRMLDLRLQGHSTAEIAQEMGLKSIALRVRMTRLRQRLRASGVRDDWLGPARRGPVPAGTFFPRPCNKSGRPRHRERRADVTAPGTTGDDVRARPPPADGRTRGRGRPPAVCPP